MNEDCSDIDFEIEFFNEDSLRKIEEACNDKIEKDYIVDIFYPNHRELAQKGIEEGLHPTTRIVQIGDLDYNPCG